MDHPTVIVIMHHMAKKANNIRQTSAGLKHIMTASANSTHI